MPQEQVFVRHFEYRDAEGKRWGGTQTVPGATKADANRLLAHTAHVNGWTDIEVFPTNMPVHEQKRRINDIQRENGNPPLYDESETVAQENKPVVVVVKDHANLKLGRPLEEEHHQGVRPTTAAVPMTQPIIGAPTPNVAITEHATAQVSPTPAPPQQILTPAASQVSVAPNRPLPGQG